MEIITFIYNIFLIVLYTAVLSLAVILYLQYKKKLFLMTSVLFLFYIFDNVVIYMTEFLDSFSRHYDLQFMNVPAFKTVIIVVSCFCLSQIQREALPDKSAKADPMLLVLVALTLLFSPAMADGALKVWIYYLPCQIFTFYLGITGLLYLKKHRELWEKQVFLKYYRQILMVTVLFSVLIVMEDTIVIFAFDIYSDILVKINNRSLSEDIMSILFSAFAIRQMSLFLWRRQREAERPEALTPSKTAAVQQLDAVFFRFCQQYHLTAREQDILRVLLKDKNNQEISDELFISVGTVKTHVHNIFQKVDVAKRSQLLRLYSEYEIEERGA